MGLKEAAPKLLFHGIVSEAGRFVPDKTSWFTQLSQYKGKRVIVAIEAEKKQRSLNQNAYYWGVCIEILGKELGYTPEEMHQAAKWELLRVRSDGKPDTVRSTASLSTMEMEDYLERFRQWALSGNNFAPCYIPGPNEVAVAA